MERMAVARRAGNARRALLARKQKLVTLASGLLGEDAAGPSPSPDLASAGDPEKQRVLETLQAVELRELAEIEEALKRVARGTYGRCGQCGQDVGALRLLAVPEARFCVTCAARR